jgi:hypothetical protein
MDILDEEDHLREGFIELQRADVEPDAAEDGVRHGLDIGMVGPRRDNQGQGQRQEETAEPEEERGADQPSRPDPQRPHGNDFRVRRQSGQAAQDAHQHGHGRGKGKDRGEKQAEDADGFERRHAPVDEEFGQEEDLVHEQDEGHEEKPNEEGRHDLAEDVAVDDLQNKPQAKYSTGRQKRGRGKRHRRAESSTSIKIFPRSAAPSISAALLSVAPQNPLPTVGLTPSGNPA